MDKGKLTASLTRRMSEIIKRDKSKIDDQWDRYQCTLSIIYNFDKIFTGIEHYPVKLFVKIAFPSPSQLHNHITWKCTLHFKLEPETELNRAGNPEIFARVKVKVVFIFTS